jgi:hypothetical protein
MENARKVYVEAETATGRVLAIVADEQHGLFKIAFNDGKGGALPSKLQGRYTGVKFAEHDLNRFVNETFKIAADHVKTKKPKDEAVAA